MDFGSVTKVGENPLTNHISPDSHFAQSHDKICYFHPNDADVAAAHSWIPAGLCPGASLRKSKAVPIVAFAFPLISNARTGYGYSNGNVSQEIARPV